MTQPAMASDDIAVGTNNIRARPGRLCSVILTPAAAASSVIVYDTATGTAVGTVLVRLTAVANGASTVLPISPNGISYNKGLTAVVAGTGAICNLSFITE